MSQHHDPVHPDSGHLTPELLADLAEGLLDATSAQHATAHLDHCSLCQAVQASLRDVSSTLAALPTPSMPDDVEAQDLVGPARSRGRRNRLPRRPSCRWLRSGRVVVAGRGRALASRHRWLACCWSAACSTQR